jgi:signal transduction histidine kinase
MNQVFSNLIGNALKFTPAGGLVHVGWSVRAAELVVSVRDTGEGIPEHQLAQVFSPFWQNERAERNGLGLGLVITRAIVEAHGGRIWIESAAGQGTTVHFTVPLLDSVPAPAVPASTAELRP